MDYKQFLSHFDFIFLSGLKGQERVCEIQDKNTNRMYDYKEVIKEGDDIETQKNYCQDFLMTLNHPNILKLITYSYCFIEENHGFPYCKFFLVFEYCESSLDRELQTLLKKKKFIKTQRLSKIFFALLSSLIYLHGKKSLHRELVPEYVCLTDKDEYKLMPQIKVKSTKPFKIAKYKENLKKIYETKPNIHKPQKSSSEYSKKNSISSMKTALEYNLCKVYQSPETYQNEKNRVAYKRLAIDPYLSETFSLGMMVLSVGILENLEAFYKTFTVDETFLKEKLQKFQNIHGPKLSTVLGKLLEIDPEKRCSFETALVNFSNEDKVFNSPMDISNEINNSKNNSPSKLKHVGTKKKLQKNQTFTEENEEVVENSLIHKLFNQLPQEYQDEIDKKVSEKLNVIEDENYQPDMYSSGDRYQGEKNDNDVPHGWGIYWWANGERYEGHFTEGKYDGEGIYYWPTGVKHYGEFTKGEITGIGVRYYVDGGIYYGQWEKGKNHGKGTYFWMTGAKYQGGFIEDMIYGKGVLTWPEEDGKTVRHYEGLWKDVNPKGITVEQSIKKSLSNNNNNN